MKLKTELVDNNNDKISYLVDTTYFEKFITDSKMFIIQGTDSKSGQKFYTLFNIIIKKIDYASGECLMYYSPSKKLQNSIRRVEFEEHIDHGTKNQYLWVYYHKKPKSYLTDFEVYTVGDITDPKLKMKVMEKVIE